MQALLAACCVGVFYIKRQKEHLLAERNNIETEMRGLQAQQVAGGRVTRKPRAKPEASEKVPPRCPAAE